MATINLNPGETIQAAINRAAAGDIIVIPSGVYNENIRIDKAITLQGPNQGIAPTIPDINVANGINVNQGYRTNAEAWIQGKITVAADNVTIDGFRLRNEGGPLNWSETPDNFKLLNNYVTGYNASNAPKFGEANSNNPTNVVTGWEISGNYVGGLTDGTGGSMYLAGLSNSSISNNTFWRPRAAHIYLASLTDVNIQGNNFYHGLHTDGFNNDGLDNFFPDGGYVRNFWLELVGTNDTVNILNNEGSFNSGGIQLHTKANETNDYVFNNITIQGNEFPSTNFINPYTTAPTNGLSGLIPAVMATAIEGGASGSNLVIRENNVSLDLSQVKYATDHKSSIEVRGNFNGVTVQGNTVTPTGTNNSTDVSLLTGLSLNGSLPGPVLVQNNQFLGANGNPNGDSYYGIDFSPTLANYGEFTGTLNINGNTINNWQVGVTLRLATPGPDVGNLINVANNTFTGNTVDVFDQIPPRIITGSISYQENQAAGNVLGIVNADDNLANTDDVGVKSYAIAGGNENGFFSINPSTGAISLTPAGLASAANDFEANPNQFSLQITVTDAGGLTGTGTVNLNVTDDNQTLLNKYNFTYSYGGNGDSYSGYFYAPLQSYLLGQVPGLFNNETGTGVGFYTITSIEDQVFENSFLNGQVFVTSYNDVDTGFGVTTNLTPPPNQPHGLLGLGSESGFARRPDNNAADPSFSNFFEADLQSENVYFEYTYFYSGVVGDRTKDYYTGFGYANRNYIPTTGTYSALNPGQNDTGSQGIYNVTRVTETRNQGLSGTSTIINVVDYFDVSTDNDGAGIGGYGKANSVTSFTGTSGLGSESGIAYNSTLIRGADSNFTPLNSADIVTEKTSLQIRVPNGSSPLQRSEGSGGVTTPFRFEVVRSGNIAAPLTVNWRVQPEGTFFFTQASASDFVGNVLPSGTVTFAANQSVATLSVNVLGDNFFEFNEGFKVNITNPNTNLFTVTRASVSGIILNDDSLFFGWTFGDPHLITLDGFAYDFMAVGEFVLLETTPDSSDPFQIQVRYEPLPGSQVASVATRMAVQLDGGRVEIRLGDNPLLVNGQAVPLANGRTIDLNGDGITDIQRDGNKYTITLNNLGEQVQVNIADTFMDVLPSVTPPQEGSNRNFRGLFGNLDGNRANDLTDRNGTVYAQDPIDFTQLYGPFANSWRVDANAVNGKASLFTYGANQAVGSFDNSNFPQGKIDINQLPQTLRDQAIAVVDAAGITDPLLRESAIYDFLLTGDQSFVNSVANTSVVPVEEGTFGATAPVLTALGVSVNPTSVVEGNVGTKPVTFTIFRTDGTGALTVDYRLELEDNLVGVADANDLATGTPPNGVVNFAAGETEKQVTVQVQGDTTIEPDEGLRMVITPGVGSNVQVATNSATTTIVNDDFPPVTINPIATDDVINSAEQQAGVDVTGTADPGIEQVRVTIGNAEKTVPVTDGAWTANFTQNDLTQNGGFNVQAVGIAGGVAQPAATRALFIDSLAPNIPVINAVTSDNVINPADNEAGVQLTGTAELNSTVELTFGDFTRILTAIGGQWSAIIAPGALPTNGELTLRVTATDAVGNISALASQDVRLNQSPSFPNPNAEFTVPENTTPVGTIQEAIDPDGDTVTYSLLGDDASKFNFDPDTRVLSFIAPPDFENPGDVGGNNIYDVTVRATDNFGAFGNQNIKVTVTGGGGIPPSLAISATSANKNEGNQGVTPFTFTVTRSVNTTGPFTVSYTVAGSGTNPANAVDFGGGTLPSGSVAFADGETTKVVTINVNGDVDVEPDETFTVSLTPRDGINLITPSAVGTIINDDQAPPTPSLAISATSANKNEGNQGVTPFTFTVTRSVNTTGPLTVNYTVAGSGTNPANAVDFVGGTLPSGSVVFADGETTKVVTINVNGDVDFEPDETFTVSLTPRDGINLTTPSAVGTIINDDRSVVNASDFPVGQIVVPLTPDTATEFVDDAIGRTFSPSTSGDILRLFGDGFNTIQGSPAQLNGDLVQNFVRRTDLIKVTDSLFSASGVTVTSGSAILDIDANNDGTSDSTITLEGDYTDALFLVNPDENSNSTDIRYDILNSRINRFQNRDVPGTYLFAGEEESRNIRANFPQFVEEGIAAYVASPGSSTGESIYRFQNKDVPGTYIFVGEQERNNIIANFPQFALEGEAFEIVV